MFAEALRIYVNPMDAPGRAKGAFETMTALEIVLQKEHPHAMDEVLRELERARMSAEDWRGAMVSPYPYNTGRLRSWREFGMERNDMCNHMQWNMIDPAMDILASARARAREAWDGPATKRRKALIAAENAMWDAEHALLDEEKYNEEMESEDDQEMDDGAPQE